MIFSLGIILMFLRLGINATSGFITHYASFMASRTYLVVENGSRDPAGSDRIAFIEARRVFEDFRVQQFGVRDLNVNQDFRVNDPEQVGRIRYEYVGVRLRHSSPLSLIPFLGQPIDLELVTESFLGREPSRGDCLARICRAMGDSRRSAVDCTNNVAHLTLFDNGC